MFDASLAHHYINLNYAYLRPDMKFFKSANQDRDYSIVMTSTYDQLPLNSPVERPLSPTVIVNCEAPPEEPSDDYEHHSLTDYNSIYYGIYSD